MWDLLVAILEILADADITIYKQAPRAKATVGASAPSIWDTANATASSSNGADDADVDLDDLDEDVE